jgi:hypothetical protein
MNNALVDPSGGFRGRGLLPLRLAGAAAVIAVASALGGCAPDPAPATGTEIEDVHLSVIREVVPDADLEYKKVTVPGQVKDVISPSAFSISDPNEPAVDPLLIVDPARADGLAPGVKVKVTGIVYRGFSVGDAKEKTGIALDGALHKDWKGDSYIVASQVDVQK